MHILHIIESLTTGGKERQLIELAHGLSADGDMVTILVMSKDISYGLERLEGVKLLTLERHTRHDMGYSGRLYKLVRELRPDVIHSWGSMCSVFVTPVARILGIPLVNGIIRDAPNNMDWRNKDYRRGRLTFPFSAAVLGNSKAGLVAYGAPADRSICIYNGFDNGRLKHLKALAATRAELRIATPYAVAMTATFSDRKDFRSYFEAARIMTRDRDDVTFLSVGGGALLQDFQRDYPEAEFPHIRILGRRGDVEDIAAACDVGVLMSNAAVHGEGIPNAVMEFMALEKPVVVSDSGGVAELVTEGEQGFIVGDKDVPALVQRIGQLLDDPALAATLGRNGAARVTQEFSIDRMVGAHHALYRRVAGGRWTAGRGASGAAPGMA